MCVLVSKVFSPGGKYFAIKNKNGIPSTSYPNDNSVYKGMPLTSKLGLETQQWIWGEARQTAGEGLGKGPPEQKSFFLKSGSSACLGTRPQSLASLLVRSYFQLCSCEAWPTADSVPGSGGATFLPSGDRVWVALPLSQKSEPCLSVCGIPPRGFLQILIEAPQSRTRLPGYNFLYLKTELKSEVLPGSLRVLRGGPGSRCPFPWMDTTGLRPDFTPASNLKPPQNLSRNLNHNQASPERETRLPFPWCLGGRVIPAPRR